MIRRFLRQGSWAQRTIIKPQPGHEFDADVLVEMKQQRTWADDPKQYLLAVHDALQTAPRYRSRVELKTRCVRVVYAGDCHVDLVPYVHTSGWFERHEIVARIMRSAGLRADKVRRDFTVDAANLNSRWCGDITYISTWEGWLYLATVIDIASRRVVGYAMADHLRTGLVADALGNAVAARDPAPGVIFHSDRGCQYTSAAFGGLAGDFHVELSHGRTGQCWDNALAESVLRLDQRRADRPAALAHPGPASDALLSSTSAGTTAPACTAAWDTSAQPSSKPATATRSRM